MPVFCISEYHTYFVGDDGVLVHNECVHEFTKKVLRRIKKTDGLNDAVEKAVEKGIVSPGGQTGIKALTGAKNYTHEIKLLGNRFGDVRIFGNQLKDGSFKWTKFGNHKTKL